MHFKTQIIIILKDMRMYSATTVTFAFVPVATIDKKYGRGTFSKNEHEIRKRCNQKCLDKKYKLKKMAASNPMKLSNYI